MAKAAASITEQLPLEGKSKDLTGAAITSGDIKGTVSKEISAQKQTAISEIKAPITAPFEEKKQQIKDKVELKKQHLEDTAKQKGKQLVGKDEPELTEADELAAEISAENEQLKAKTNKTPATAAQLEAVKQAEIRLEQAKVLLDAAKQKQTTDNNTEAKVLVMTAKDQLRKAEKELADAKIVAGVK